MIWQDLVISVACIVFSISLIPQVYRGFRDRSGSISLLTSIPTIAGLYVMAIAYLTLSLFYSAALSVITGTLWMILLMQRVAYGSAPRKK